MGSQQDHHRLGAKQASRRSWHAGSAPPDAATSASTGGQQSTLALRAPTAAFTCAGGERSFSDVPTGCVASAPSGTVASTARRVCRWLSTAPWLLPSARRLNHGPRRRPALAQAEPTSPPPAVDGHWCYACPVTRASNKLSASQRAANQRAAGAGGLFGFCFGMPPPALGPTTRIEAA